MKKLVLFISFFIALSSLAKAQDEAVFMHYSLNPILINPGSAGINNTHDVLLNLRTQWAGFVDAPKTYAINYNGPLGKKFGIGVGLFSEQAAQLSRVKGKLNYSFRFEVQDQAKIGVGLFMEWHQMNINTDITTGGKFYQAGDVLLDDLLNGRGEFDAGIGVFGTLRENTFGGFTLNNLVKSRLDDIADESDKTNIFSYYTFLVGHKFEVKDLNVHLEPSLLFRQIKGTPFQADVNLKASFMDEQLVAGVSYRSLGAMGILLGTKLSKFSLYYSYDVGFQQFQQYNTGSHEITIAFNFKKKPKSTTPAN